MSYTRLNPKAVKLHSSSPEFSLRYYVKQTGAKCLYAYDENNVYLTDIEHVQDGSKTQSELGISITNNSGYTTTISSIQVYGKVMFATLSIKPNGNISAGTVVNPCSISGLRSSCMHSINGERIHGDLNTNGSVWVCADTALTGGTSYNCSFVALLP